VKAAGSGWHFQNNSSVQWAASSKSRVSSAKGCTFWIGLKRLKLPRKQRSIHAFQVDDQIVRSGGRSQRSFAWKTTCPISGFLEVILES